MRNAGERVDALDERLRVALYMRPQSGSEKNADFEALEDFRKRAPAAPAPPPSPGTGSRRRFPAKSRSKPTEGTPAASPAYSTQSRPSNEGSASSPRVRLHGLALTHAVRPGADSVEPGRGGAVEHLQDLLGPARVRGRTHRDARRLFHETCTCSSPPPCTRRGTPRRPKRVPLTRTNASRSCRAMPPKDRAERSSFAGRNVQARLGRSTGEAAVARSTVAAAPARWRRCCASSSQPTMAASSAVSFPPYPATEGVLRVGEDEGCLVPRRVRRVRASRQHREERERDDARGGTPNAARRSGSSRGDRTRRDHARRGVCSALCALDDGRSRGSTRPRPPSRCQNQGIFLTFGCRWNFGDVHVRGEARQHSRKSVSTKTNNDDQDLGSRARHTQPTRGSRAKTRTGLTRRPLRWALRRHAVSRRARAIESGTSTRRRASLFRAFPSMSPSFLWKSTCPTPRTSRCFAP